MKSSLAMLVVVVLGAALLVGAVWQGSPVEITYHYSTDADSLLAPLVQAFNNSHATVDGHPIHVTTEQKSSGIEMLELAAGGAVPTAWTPASQVWGGQLGQRTDTDPPALVGSLVTSPEVFAIWCSEASRHGWVDREAWEQRASCERVRDPSWAEVVDLASRGNPMTPDSFLLGQTNPEASTSGAFALASQYLTVTGEPLTPSNVEEPANRAAVRSVERSLIHYGPTSKEVKDRLCELGQAYVSGVYLQETTVLELNEKTCHWGDKDKLMAFYPSGGTFVADYPFYNLADPGTLQAAAAQKLGTWLLGRLDAGDEALLGSNFRARGAAGAATSTGTNGTPLDPDGVIDPQQPKVPVLALPDPAALRRAQDNWKTDRNPARVALVVDISGPMKTGDQLDAMKDGLHRLVDELRLGDSVSDEDRDQVSLTTFSATVQEPLLTMGTHTQQEIDNAIEAIKLKNDGGTALFDGVWAGFQPFRSLTYADEAVINAMIVVSSGVNDAGQLTEKDLLTPSRILPNLASRPLTRVFTVELGETADATPTPALSDMSQATYGSSFIGGADAIVHAFENIPAYF